MRPLEQVFNQRMNAADGKSIKFNTFETVLFALNVFT